MAKKNNFNLKKTLLIAIPALVVAGGIAYAVIQKPRFVACSHNDEINTALRKDAETLAFTFAEEINNGKNKEAYAKLADETRKNLAEKDFDAIQAGIAQFGLKDLKISDTYYIKVSGGKEIARATCGDTSNPEGWAAMNVKPSAKQAYVLVNGTAPNNSGQYIIWLQQDNGKWAVNSFIVAPTTVLDKNYKDLTLLAREELKKQHNFNAFLLYLSAYQLASRGPDFQLGTLPALEQEMKQVTVPEQFRGQPPHTLEDNGQKFKIMGMGPIAVEEKIYLMVNHEVEPWASERAADKNNRALMATVAKLYPEYKDVFAGIITRAYDTKNNLFYGSVEGKPAAETKAPAKAARAVEEPVAETESVETE